MSMYTQSSYLCRRPRPSKREVRYLFLTVFLRPKQSTDVWANLHECKLEVIWFNAPHVMWSGGIEGLHQKL